MMEANQDEKFDQVARKLDPQGRLLRAWELQGGVSAQVTALEVERADGRMTKLIVRQHGAVDLEQHPDVAVDEFTLLQLLHAEGMPTPKPYLLDQSGEIFATPYIVIEYVEGETEFAPANISDLLSQLATHLSRIHRIDDSTPAVSVLPRQERRFAGILRERPALDAAGDEARIRDALEAVWPPPQRNRSVLLHGDYWPGNVLWKDGKLVAIIDWEDAAVGDPLADVGNCRLEILWAFGVEAMQSFTQQYQATTDIEFTNLPYWDLCAALRLISGIGEWVADEPTERAMRERLHWFIAQALDRLSLP
ncbi:MAG TPA: phosphotransferase [Ktedonobacterales bacterium]